MKSVKLLGTAALFTAMFATSVHPAAAIYNVNQGQSADKLDPNQAVILSQPLDSAGGLHYNLVVNGKGLSRDENKVYENNQKEIMVPLRAIAEELGYKLTWNPETQGTELVKGNQWFLIKIGEDQYNIARMNVTLGTAPELKDDKTYVPLKFVQDVLKENVTVGVTGTITISSEKSEEVAANTKEGTITNIITGEKGSQIELNGFLNGIRLNISDETEIVTEDNQKRTVSDLALGMEIKVVHAPFMTLSIPPMTTAEKIIVKGSQAAKDTLGTAGEIAEVTTAADGSKKVLVKGEKLTDLGYEQIYLRVDKDTPILSTKDNQPLSLDDLKQGAKVYAFYGPIVTKSMPPMGGATKILVENE
ncbi:copper amine oxidase N-terminal domain-containing protein [Brevibacillus sp. B_LB10_24]|uniref:copper amine oxidase N-terminal domain-containing protein n=1 Tax=Brevibacillus sp. B_LB10_24 TaxID=3380645 RepID=UPI0038BD1816